MEHTPHYSVIIPVYNEEQSLLLLHERLRAVMDALAQSYEVIYVDDDSTDGTAAQLQAICAGSTVGRVVRFDRNRGQSEALFAGFSLARGAWIVTLDADLQNPPESIPDLVKCAETCDFVTGIRISRKDPFSKKLVSAVAWMVRRVLLGDVTSDTGCGLKLFKRDIKERIPLFNHFHRFLPYLARKNGFSVREVAVEHHPRLFGESKYGILRRGWEGAFDVAGLLGLHNRLLPLNKHYDSAR